MIELVPRHRLSPDLQAHFESLLRDGGAPSSMVSQLRSLAGGSDFGNNADIEERVRYLAQQLRSDAGASNNSGRRGLSRQSSNDAEAGNLLGLTSLSGNDAIIDEEMRIGANVEALRAGLWDKAAAEIGGACVAWAKVARKYVDAGLLDALSEALPACIAAGEDVMAVRVLQLTEMIVRIFGDGHGNAALVACGWFITSRRPVSRKFVRSNAFEVYMKQIVPSSDLASLKRMWKSDTFDPSWRHRESGFDMLSFAVYNACAPDFIEFLVNPISGCRGVVNVQANSLTAQGTPLIIAAQAKCITREHMNRDVARYANMCERMNECVKKRVNAWHMLVVLLIFYLLIMLSFGLLPFTPVCLSLLLVTNH
jgi:hypothetical protein